MYFFPLPQPYQLSILPRNQTIQQVYGDSFGSRAVWIPAVRPVYTVPVRGSILHLFLGEGRPEGVLGE